MRGRLDPLVVVGEAGVGTHGAHDAIARDLYPGNVFHDVLEDGAQIPAASFEKAGRVGVPVKRIGRDAVFVSDAGGLMPVDELLLDRLSIWMMTDAAFALVALERCLGFRRASDEAFRFARDARGRLRFPAPAAGRPSGGLGRSGSFESFFAEKHEGAIERGELGGEFRAGTSGISFYFANREIGDPGVSAAPGPLLCSADETCLHWV